MIVDPALSVNDAATIVARVKAALREHVPAFDDAVIAVAPAGRGAEGAGDMAPTTHPTG